MEEMNVYPHSSRLLLAVVVMLALVTVACNRGGEPDLTGRPAGAEGQPAVEPAGAPGSPAAPPVCSTTLRAGGDLTAAIMGAAPGATLCLGAGVHRAFSVNRPPAGVTVTGTDEGEAIFPLSGRNSIGIRNAERFTLARVIVRNGAGDGVYTANARGLILRDIMVERAANGVHIDDRSSATLSNITVTGSRGFGLLLRRLSNITATDVRVRDAEGIGIGAVDGVGTVSISESDVIRTALPARAEAIVAIGADKLVLTNVSVRGGNPAGLYAGKTAAVQLRGVRVESAHFGLHIDDGSAAELDGVTLTGSDEVGLLVRQSATVTGTNVRIADTAGTGVSAIAKPGLVTLRDSDIGPAGGPGLFMGAAGCDNLPPASLDIPGCFLTDPQSFIADGRVELQRVALHDTVGPCLVFFPGTHAELRDSTLTRCALTGLFAWGAEANVTGTAFDDNAEHALEYRAYPDPRRDILREASGTIAGSAVRGTRPLEGAVLGPLGPGPVLGGGILAQRSRLDVRDTEVVGNSDIGVSYVNGSTGELSGVRITANSGTGLCLLADARVRVRDTVIAGNRSDDPRACGGAPLVGR